MSFFSGKIFSLLFLSFHSEIKAGIVHAYGLYPEIKAEIKERNQRKEIKEGIKSRSAWYDCSKEENVQTPSFQFTNVSSDPGVVTPTSGQTIYKTIQYSGAKTLTKIYADFHQYYKVFGYWVRFRHLHTVNECAEHSELCPFKSNTLVNLKTIHPPQKWLTPYGWYRSRQVYRDGETDEKLGCVDHEIEYRAWTQNGEENEINYENVKNNIPAEEVDGAANPQVFFA